MRRDLLASLLASAAATPWAMRPEVMSAAQHALMSGGLASLNVDPRLEALIGTDLDAPVSLSVEREAKEGEPAAGWRTFTAGERTVSLDDEEPEDEEATSPPPEREDEPEAHGEPVRAALDRSRERAVARQAGGVAVIPCRGTISNRVTLFDLLFGGGVTPPAWLLRQVKAALADEAIKAVVVDYDTPGGSVLGVEEAAQGLLALRGGDKPIIGQVSGLCASAGYWMGATHDELNVQPTGLVGSIGVYQLHLDWSKFYEELGVKATFIGTTPEKTEGNEFEPLSEEALKHREEMVADYMDMFANMVAKGRGVSAATVRGERFGRGRVYTGARSVSRGLADKVRTLPQTLLALGVGNPEPARARRGRSVALALAEVASRDV